jgi:hypothetical protein
MVFDIAPSIGGGKDSGNAALRPIPDIRRPKMPKIPASIPWRGR